MSFCCLNGDNCIGEAEITYLEQHSKGENKPEIPCSPFYSCETCLGFSNETTELPFSIIYPVESISFNSFNPDFKYKGIKTLPLKPPQHI